MKHKTPSLCLLRNWEKN